jgi:hypothetical protein
VHEASPDPPAGPDRDALAAITDDRLAAAESAVTAALEGYLTRSHGVVRSRMSGPKARRGTRWWQHKQDEHRPEVKAVDAGYVLPDRLIAEAESALRPVATRLAEGAVADTTRRLGAHQIAPISVDAIVDEAISELMGVLRRHAGDVRREIHRADGESDSLPEVLDHIEQAYRKGGNWVLLAGRTLATALLNDAAMRQAKALGVTHAQWLSRRDPQVRRTHRLADGQVRALETPFSVGEFKLRFPGDPTDLPASWPEVANCRCGLLFPKVDSGRMRDAATLRRIAKASTPSPGARRLFAEEPVTGQSHRLREPVIAYRRLAATPVVTAGQLLTLGAGVALSVAPLVATPGAGGRLLTLLLPAGLTVQLAGEVVTVPSASTAEVLETTPTEVRARITLHNGETPPVEKVGSAGPV